MSLQEIKKYTSIALKLMSLGLVIAAGSFWAAAGVDSRPKYRDEQTLVGGTIWSQILIPLGLMISTTVGEELDTFIHGYYLITGVVLLFTTGITLVTYECKHIAKQRCDQTRKTSTGSGGVREKLKKVVSFKLEYDKIYLTIGVLSLSAGVFTLADFVVLMI